MISKTMTSSVISVWPECWINDKYKRDVGFLRHVILQAECVGKDEDGERLYLIESVNSDVISLKGRLK